MSERVVYVVEQRFGASEPWKVESVWETREEAEGEASYPWVGESRVVEYVPREEVAEEREACAKVARDLWPSAIPRDDEQRSKGYYDGAHWQGLKIAAAIRRRGGEA